MLGPKHKVLLGALVLALTVNSPALSYAAKGGNGNGNGNANGNGNGNGNGNSNNNGNGNGNGNGGGSPVNPPGQGSGEGGPGHSTDPLPTPSEGCNGPAAASNPHCNPGGGNTGGGDNGGGNNGGGDNGGGDDNGGGKDDDTKNETPAQKEEQKKKKELKAKLLPAFFLDFDAGNKIINKTSYDASRADKSLVKFDYNSARDTMVYGDYRSGFQVTSYKRFEAGLGANVLFYYENATGLSKALWASVGLIPYAGRELVSTRSAKSLEDAYNMPSLSLPTTADALASWTPGDNVSFASKGGIIFFAGPGLSAVSLTTSYVSTGIYQTYVEKVDSENVIVRITDIQTNSVGLQSGAALVSVGTSTYKTVAGSFSYLVNVKDPVGYKAYNDLVRGNIAPVQKLAADSSIKSVQKWDKITRKQVGKLNSFFFGLPIVLNTSWTSGKIYELSNTQTFFDNTQTTVNYGIYIKDRRNRVLNKHSSMTEAFYGGVVKIKSIGEKSATKAYFGQYSWTAEDDSTSHTDIRTDVNELIQKTGLQKELAVNLPSLKNLGFSSVALKMNLSEEMTFRVMKKILALSDVEIGDKAKAKAEKYFSTQADAWNLCSQQAHENFDNCANTQKSLARSAGKTIFKTMASMEYHYKNNADREFALAYADFGKAVLASPFVFQTLLDLAGEGLELEYIVNNTYFSSYHIKLVTTNKSGVFAKSFIPHYDFVALTPATPANNAGLIVGPGVNKQSTP